MCLILFCISPDSEHRLVIAANRDELYARPTARPTFWEDAPEVLAGRDLQAGGTWLGISRRGRFAAVTNFREAPMEPVPPLSRGALTADFLRSTESCSDYIDRIKPQADQYRGFNLLIDDGQDTYYYSNRSADAQRLAPGYYGLSNQLLDCNWPKVNSGRADLCGVADAGFSTQALFNLLADRGDDKPFSARFIHSDSYGTSASTVVKIKHNQHMTFEERAFLAHGEPATSASFEVAAEK
ncbi:MAG: hypothetical protein ACI81O_002057 [Cyclobacteriaceae bacterium]|jgi:uncharacterized protein with NRDE domain